MIFHAVIPVFNRIALTIRCLESLTEQTEKNMEIVVIDDGSTDGTSQAIKEHFPNVQILSGSGNLWWTGSINVGIRHVLLSAAPDDYVLLVNNDTYFDHDFVSRCQKVVKKHPNSLIGSVIVDPRDKKIIQGGIRVNWYSAKNTWLNLNERIDEFPPGYIKEVSVLTGRGVLIPCQVFREVGLYDDRHFQQCGDTELPRRANLKNFSLNVSYDLICYNSDLDHHQRHNIPGFVEYFFGVRSQTRLKYRIWFAINTANNPLQGASFLVCDIGRVVGHYIRATLRR